MTNEETIKHIRDNIDKPRGHFSWITDGCGYEQHIKFVKHRNDNWCGDSQDEWKKFVLDYADELEKEQE